MSKLGEWTCGECKKSLSMSLLFCPDCCKHILDKPKDKINPDHYKSHPSGVECIQITEWLNFCIGNAVKYLWRADLKNGIEDLEKAAWYINREITRRKNGSNK